eukprot:Lithocolla_globosa_v1_NODE_641_length_3531_cov_128.763809.p3 type:complete len:299 gc:universal NODE_641_length_3531_cov_128.763809:1886-990(-)
MKEQFGDIQFAIATPGASATAITCLKEGLDHHTDSLLLQADYKAAYQLQDRAEALARIYDTPQFAQSWRLLDWSYGQGATILAIIDAEGNIIHRIDSTGGWKQGCVLGPFGFAGGALKTFKVATEGLKGINKAAIIDDFNVSGHPKSVFEVYDRLREQSSVLNLQLHPTKTHISWLHKHPVPQWIIDEAKTREIEIKVGGDECLGSPIDADYSSPYVAGFIAEKIEKHQKLFDLINHEEMPKQIAKEILKGSAIPKMSYIMKTVEPTTPVLQQFARFDQKVLGAYRQLLDDKKQPNTN